jgi:hypothetical protein
VTKQVVAEMHTTSFSTTKAAGTVTLLHEEPAFVDHNTNGLCEVSATVPTATNVPDFTHETPDSSPLFRGSGGSVQTFPALAVRKMTPT